jgi:inhibitor of KinA sporulation pathway (predicted exonuclease)
MPDLDYPFLPEVVVFDLEVTTWPGAAALGWTRPREYPEIVEIGAVRVDRSGESRVVDSFEVLVCPQRNPGLSDYFVDLTGITQERLDVDGVTFPEAMARFAAFCGADSLLASNGADDRWLFENCGYHGLPCPIAWSRFVNVEYSLAEAMGRQVGECTSGDLPELLGFALAGSGHRADYDARAVAEAMIRLGLFPVHRDDG